MLGGNENSSDNTVWSQTSMFVFGTDVLTPFALVIHRGIIMATILNDLLETAFRFSLGVFNALHSMSGCHYQIQSCQISWGNTWPTCMCWWQLGGLKRLPKESGKHNSDGLFSMHLCSFNLLSLTWTVFKTAQICKPVKNYKSCQAPVAM